MGSTSKRGRPLLLAAAGVAGCGGSSGDAGWALQHASVRAASSAVSSAASGDAGISGYQVWEFFEERWEKGRDGEHHVCSLVQEVSGTSSGPLAGCEDCQVTFAVTATFLESDCDADLAERADFASMTHYALGPVATDIAGSDPFPGQSMGWYVSWDGLSVQAQGFGWNELVEGGVPVTPQWEEDAQYTLWPAYAWEL